MATDSILPQPDILNEAEYGRFILANLAAKRARQIKDGAPPLVRIESSHPLSIALAEIAAGKIKPLLGQEAEAAMAEHPETLADLTSDRFLLPGLEEDEVLAVAVGVDEHDEETEDEEVVASASLLGGLLGEEDPEAEPAIDDEEEISLDDLARQEEEEAEPAEE